MKGDALSRRYAGALISIGMKDGQMERYGKELSMAMGMLGDAKVWSSFVSPLLPAEAKIGIIDELGKRNGWSKTAVSFLKLLVDKKRIKSLPGIVESYSDLADKAAGRVHAKVSSAIPLDDGDRARLVKQIVAMTQGKVILEADVDPALIGGAKVMVGSKVIDGTVSGQIARLKEILTKD